MSTSSPFSTVAIVGLGLMGGSLALALKQKYPAQKIIGITRTRATLDLALARGAIDSASDQLAAARAANLIVLAAPVRTILRQIADLAVWNCGHPAELAYRIGFNPLHARLFKGETQ